MACAQLRQAVHLALGLCICIPAALRTERPTTWMRAAVITPHLPPWCSRNLHPFRDASSCLRFDRIMNTTWRHRPQPSAPHTAVVRVEAAAVNPCDWEGLYAGNGFPRTACQDYAGVVEEVHEPCELEVGAEVWGMVPGAAAEYVVVDCRTTALKPTQLDFVQAAGVPTATLTALQALRKLGAPWTTGPTVFVTAGSGGVGISAIQLAKHLGAGRVVTTTSGPQHEQLTTSLGADRVIDYRKHSWWDVLEKGSVDVMLDVIPFKGNGLHALEILKDGGAYLELLQEGLDFGRDPDVCVGRKPGDDVSTRYFCTSPARPSVRLIDWELHQWTNRDLDFLRELVDQGKLRTVVDSVYNISDVAAAFQRSARGHSTGKVVIKVRNA